MKRLIVFTDLDGTLLDHDSYSFKAAAPALKELKARKIPLVLCSSKTKAEMLPLTKKLGLNHPFVVENGGAVYIPRNYFPFALPTARVRTGFQVLELGERYQKLIRSLADAAQTSGVKAKGFSSMTEREVAKLCGLDAASARLARRREYDEPFVLDEADANQKRRFFSWIQQRGLRWRQGGRFLHLMGNNDKGLAASRMIELYRQLYGTIQTVGLGDSANDVDFLGVVDVAVLVARPDGLHDTEVVSRVPRLRRQKGIGPEGWNAALLEILEELTAEESETADSTSVR